MLSWMRAAAFLSLALLIAPAVAAGEDPAPSSQGQGLDSFFLFQGVGRIAQHDPAVLGEEARRARDWTLGGVAPLRFDRVYFSSWSQRSGVLGHGWSHRYDEAIWVEDDATLTPETCTWRTSSERRVAIS